MIEQQTIDNRKASVAYLTKDLDPADKDDAELIKVVFDDGETLWLAPPPDKAKETDMVNPPRDPDDDEPEVEEPEDDEPEVGEPEDED